MAGVARYIFIASLDVDPDKETLFNELYDSEHVPLLLKVPGVLSARRCKTVQGSMAIGGKIVPLVAEGEPNYSAVYELEGADVLTSEAWARAVDAGRWPAEIRPYIRARRHVLKKLIHP
jgi:hypothetical protein